MASLIERKTNPDGSPAEITAADLAKPAKPAKAGTPAARAGVPEGAPLPATYVLNLAGMQGLKAEDYLPPPFGNAPTAEDGSLLPPEESPVPEQAPPPQDMAYPMPVQAEPWPPQDATLPVQAEPWLPQDTAMPVPAGPWPQPYAQAPPPYGQDSLYAALAAGPPMPPPAPMPPAPMPPAPMPPPVPAPMPPAPAPQANPAREAGMLALQAFGFGALSSLFPEGSDGAGALGMVTSSQRFRAMDPGAQQAVARAVAIAYGAPDGV